MMAVGNNDVYVIMIPEHFVEGFPPRPNISQLPPREFYPMTPTIGIKRPTEACSTFR